MISLWWLREPLFECHLAYLHLFDAFHNSLTTIGLLLFYLLVNSNYCLHATSGYVTAESSSFLHMYKWTIFAHKFKLLETLPFRSRTTFE
jgi:hypothetical protein